jgi:hypothetical protein
MVSIKKDSKSPTWIITKTDKEGYHTQINVTADEIVDLAKQIMYLV